MVASESVSILYNIGSLDKTLQTPAPPQYKGEGQTDRWATLPSQHPDHVRDWQRSTEASDGKYGHRDGPEESDGLRGDGLIVPVDPGLVVKFFYVLQEQKQTASQSITTSIHPHLRKRSHQFVKLSCS